MANPSYRASFSPAAACAWLALLGASSWPEVCRAQGPIAQSATGNVATNVSSEAGVLYAEAIKSFKAGEAAKALPMFERVVGLTQSPNAELYVGYCLVELNRYPEAYRAFSAAMQHATALADAQGVSKYDATREAAENQLLALNLRVAKLILSFVDMPEDLVVRVDDVAIDVAELGSPIVLQPGLHRVEALSNGHQAILREVQIETGGSKTLTLALGTRKAEPAPALLAPTTVVAKPERGVRLETFGFVAAGVGAAGLAVFAVTGLQAKSLHDRLERECPQGCSDAVHLDAAGRGKSLQTVANTSLGVGAVGLLSSAVLLYLGARQTHEVPRIALAPGDARLLYEGRF
ncbi:MAG TPA: hypothetical protein VFQ61_01415 [Polyangiaceae bacterium]|nr:hypothetical protein [Polyangiaceae bacterium]